MHFFFFSYHPLSHFFGIGWGPWGSNLIRFTLLIGCPSCHLTTWEINLHYSHDKVTFRLACWRCTYTSHKITAITEFPYNDDNDENLYMKSALYIESPHGIRNHIKQRSIIQLFVQPVARKKYLVCGHKQPGTFSYEVLPEALIST